MDYFFTIPQLPTLALLDVIEKELLINPVLEMQLSDNSANDPLADPVAILQLPIPALRDRIERELCDIAVIRSEAGDPEVRIPDERLTCLAIDLRFIELHQNPATDTETTAWPGQKIKRAQQLLETILLAVGAEIFRQQRAFFMHGPGHLVPLNLEEVARAIGTELPTVAQVIEKKLVWTAHGVVALESFIHHRPPSP